MTVKVKVKEVLQHSLLYFSRLVLNKLNVIFRKQEDGYKIFVLK